MELDSFFKLLKNKIQTILTIVAVFFIVSLVATFVQPIKYGSNFSVLIIQNNLINTDPYLASKSSEHLGSVLARVMDSHLFFKQILEADPEIDYSYFGSTLKEQSKIWKSTVEAVNIEDSGILEINIYHPFRDEAQRIALAVGKTLVEKHSDYHGFGDKVVVKVINEPVTSNIPVKPNILLNMAGAIILGLFLSLLYIYVMPEDRYSLSFFPKKKEKLLENISEEDLKSLIVKNRRYGSVGEGNKKENGEIDKVIDEIQNEYSREVNSGNVKNESNVQEENEDDYDKIVKNGNINNVLG